VYEKFTDRARKAMQFANQEAQRFNHEQVGTEHILLGLIRIGDGVADRTLISMGIDPRKVRLEVERLIQREPDIVSMGTLPKTPRAKKVLEYAMEESMNLNHGYVGTEHLLLGLFREVEGVAGCVLTNLGLNIDAVRVEVLKILGSAQDDTTTSAPRQHNPSLPMEKLMRITGTDSPENAVAAIVALLEANQELQTLLRKYQDAMTLLINFADILREHGPGKEAAEFRNKHLDNELFEASSGAVLSFFAECLKVDQTVMRVFLALAKGDFSKLAHVPDQKFQNGLKFALSCQPMAKVFAQLLGR